LFVFSCGLICDSCCTVMASVLDPVALLCRGAASAPSDQSQPAVHPSSLYHAALAGALLQQALQPMAWPAAVPTGLHHPPGLSQPGLAQPALLQQPPGLQEARGFGELAASSVPMPAIGEDCRAAGVQQGTPIQAWALESKLKAQQAQASQRHWAEKMQQQYVKGQEVLDVVQRRAEENIPKVQQLDDPAKANGGAFERLVSLMGAPGTPERRSDVSCSEDEVCGCCNPMIDLQENASSECASWEIRKQHSGERTPTSRRSRQRGRRGYAPSQVAGAFQ